MKIGAVQYSENENEAIISTEVIFNSNKKKIWFSVQREHGELLSKTVNGVWHWD